jgi:hypothetical protein
VGSVSYTQGRDYESITHQPGPATANASAMKFQIVAMSNPFQLVLRKALKMDGFCSGSFRQCLRKASRASVADSVRSDTCGWEDI